jgi:general secretion pathway protein M
VSELWSRITTAFGNLSGRERLLVSVVAILLGITVVYFAAVVPVLNAGDRAASRLDAAETEYEVVTRLRDDFAEVNQRLSGVEGRIRKGTRGSLRTTLEALAQKSAVTVESMEPQTAPTNERYRETKVEVSLKGATLPQTVKYLHEIESAQELLTVKTLRLRTRADDPQLLDVVFTVSSFERI